MGFMVYIPYYGSCRIFIIYIINRVIWNQGNSTATWLRGPCHKIPGTLIPGLEAPGGNLLGETRHPKPSKEVPINPKRDLINPKRGPYLLGPKP